MSNNPAKDRLEFQKKLEDIVNLEHDGDKHVYFKPPASMNMKYPAIRYEINSIDNKYSNDSMYIQNRSYIVTIIDRRPESPIVDDISKLPKTKFLRSYPTDGLYHTVFVIYI